MTEILVPASNDFSAWPKRHARCIAVDWDGTCKDTMVPKWRKGFNLAIPQIWPALAPHQKEIDQVCWDVNLVEPTAGVQRFVGLTIMMDRWAKMGLPAPDLSAFARAVQDVSARGEKHGIDTYRRLQKEYGYDDTPLAWSDLSDRIIAENTKDARLFDNCREALEGVAKRGQEPLCTDSTTIHSPRDTENPKGFLTPFPAAGADVLVVSASKTEAVRRDILHDGMAHLFAALLAQDFLPKPGILKGLAKMYEHVLFVGDTQEDVRAAAASGAPLYLVKVGDEAASWAQAPAVFERFFRDELKAGEVIRA